MVTGQDNIIGHDGALPRPMKIFRMFWLGVRSPFRSASDGYVTFLERTTLPTDDTGIVAVTVRL